jgi:hypothetical protein
MADGSEVLLTRQQAAEACGLSARQFDEAIRPRVKENGTRGARHGLRYVASAVVTAYVNYRLDQAKPKEIDGDDPFLDANAGADSPALERYRSARAHMAELDVSARLREVVRRASLMEAVSPAIAAMRSVGDKLTRDFGNEAGETFNEGVAEFEKIFVEELRKLDAADIQDSAAG